MAIKLKDASSSEITCLCFILAAYGAHVYTLAVKTALNLSELFYCLSRCSTLRELRSVIELVLPWYCCYCQRVDICSVSPHKLLRNRRRDKPKGWVCARP